MCICVHRSARRSRLVYRCVHLCVHLCVRVYVCTYSQLLILVKKGERASSLIVRSCYLRNMFYMHIVWNVHFEAVSLRKEEKGWEMTFRHVVKGVHGAKGLKTTVLGN